MRILFVTDLHGSNQVFRKSLRLLKQIEASVLLVGGDISGKYLVPIVANGAKWAVQESGRNRLLHDGDEVLNYVQAVGEVGGYGVVCSPEEAAELRSDNSYREEVLKRERIKRLRQWINEAARQLLPGQFLLNMGNDDPFYLDGEVRDAGGEILEERQVQLKGFTVVSCGYTNPTPWNCPRDCSEEELWGRLESKFGQCDNPRRVIANFHCPPNFSRLDRAPRLDRDLRPIIGIEGVEYVHVGSVAVRRALEVFNPALSLHGHIHEAYGKDYIGDTICVNPGSSYYEGSFRGVVVHLSQEKIEGVQLVREN